MIIKQECLTKALLILNQLTNYIKSRRLIISIFSIRFLSLVSTKKEGTENHTKIDIGQAIVD